MYCGRVKESTSRYSKKSHCPCHCHFLSLENVVSSWHIPSIIGFLTLSFLHKYLVEGINGIHDLIFHWPLFLSNFTSNSFIYVVVYTQLHHGPWFWNAYPYVVQGVDNFTYYHEKCFFCGRVKASTSKYWENPLAFKVLNFNTFGEIWRIWFRPNILLALKLSKQSYRGQKTFIDWQHYKFKWIFNLSM